MKQSTNIFRIIALSTLVIIYSMLNAQQNPDTAIYVPQINITTANGFGPYIIGETLTDIIVADDLPSSTSKITFRFLDIDGNQVGDAYVKTGSNLDSASWNVALENLDLPLSPSLNVELIYSGDSLARYFIPYAVYPDTMIIESSMGFGPFVSNDYALSDTLWQPTPEIFTDFTAKVLPPRTEKVVFYLMNETAAIDSFYVSSLPGMYMDSARWENVQMDILPLSTRQLKVVAFSHGGPDFGISTEKDLTMNIQEPVLKCFADSLIFWDSIPPAIQNQTDGHVLLVDSLKQMRVTNMPGGNNLSDTIGSYSFMIIMKWSIESWIRIDLNKILEGIDAEMSFMKVDSAWEMVMSNEPETEMIKFTLNCLYQPGLEIATAEVPWSALQETEWHHFAFTTSEPGSIKHFYFDGSQVETNVNIDNINLVLANISEYLKMLRTQPLVFGGCNAQPGLRSDDFSLITAMDEIRFWNSSLGADEIFMNYAEPILQSNDLIGYWNFNDLNCNGLNVADLSYQCNNGTLGNGAKLTDQYPGIQIVIDTIVFFSSHALTDSVQFDFIDKSNVINDSFTLYPEEGEFELHFDIESLPYTTNLLRTTEYYPHNNGGKIRNYKLLIFPPVPIVTIRTGWGNYYASSTDGFQYIGDTSVLYNPVTISALPPQTKKITLGFENSNAVSDTASYTVTANPYHHSLTLNGTDDYIKSNDMMSNAGPEFTIMFWFKTTTSSGGMMAGYQALGFTDKDGPFIKMKTDGAIEFSFRLNDTLHTLYASNKFNDGKWHHLAATYDGNNTKNASLYIDGTLTDRQQFEGEYWWYQSNFYIGYNFNSSVDNEKIADYFQGSFSEICEYNDAMDYDYINQQMYLPEKHLVVGDDLILYYKLDEGGGFTVNDATGYNHQATLHGSGGMWYRDNQLLYATWNKNILKETAGEYTFFADVFYDGGPEEGMRYQLGRINMLDPTPGFDLTYNLEDGIGYFDEGTIIDNVLKLWTNYHTPAYPYWQGNTIDVSLIDPYGVVLDQKSYTYTDDSITFFDTIDMGEALTGSYLMIKYGYDSLGHFIPNSTNCIPVFTRSIIPPKVTGNFGPFDQAIAPGAMKHYNRFTIITEAYNDLHRIEAKFYDIRGGLIADTAAYHLKDIDTIWYIHYDMAQLSPPVTNMKIEYYLGNDPVPALVVGPFQIKITRTRPFWFNFVKNGDFSNISQPPGSDTVTFEIKTPFQDMQNYHQSAEFEIPDFIPLVGGLTSKMGATTGNASLRYYIPDYKLSLENCQIKNKIWHIGAGNGRVAMLDVNVYNNASFYLDEENNLFASENMGGGGQVSSPLVKYTAFADKIKKLVQLTGAVNPVSAIVSPSLNLTFSIGFQFSSRQHLMIDTIAKNGEWGSVGNLTVEADSIKNPHAYNNSASFHFYAGSIGANLEIDLEFFEGIAEAAFSTSFRLDLGFGKSYITIPYQDDKFLKSLGIDIYGKVVVRALWGWVESTVWGPQMFYTKTLWGDKMGNCFPPAAKNYLYPFAVPSGGDHPMLVSQVMPATWFNKMPLAYPEASTTASDNYQLFTWVERGDHDGERRIRTKYLDRNLQKFSIPMTIENNDHLINAPFSDAVDDNNILLTWAQSRYEGKNLVKIKGEAMVRSFVESQDIWYAVYDINNDSLLQTVMIKDDTKGLRTGRSEAKPVITTISDSKALITWQVADLINHMADIWYVELSKVNGVWNHSDPKTIARMNGIETNLRIASPEEGMAVLVWITTDRSDSTNNKIRYAVYADNGWGTPQDIVDEPGHYYNYLNMVFNNEKGALVYATYVEDADSLHHEELSLIPWDYTDTAWAMNEYVQLMTDTICHLSRPCVSIRNDGTTAIAIKIEELRPKFPDSKISQVDLFTGDLTNTWVPWNHFVANEYICDTTKQVSGLAISFIGQDTLMILTHEFVMNATNPTFEPKNGVFFGDPYMNLVLRSFRVDGNNTVVNIEESNYFTGVNAYVIPQNKLRLNQNYPNPTNGETTITFEIPDNSQTVAELFDMSGHKIATLLDLKMIAGEYSFTLNTSTLIPGSYICRLTSCNQHADITIIVTR